MAEKLCSFCHSECDLNKIQIKKDYAGREYICYNCYKSTGINDFVKITKMTADEIRPYIDVAKQSDERRSEFHAEKYVIGYIEADEKQQYWSLLLSSLVNDTVVHGYGEIKDFRLVINDNVYDSDRLCGIDKHSEVFSTEKNAAAKKGLFGRKNECSKMEIIIDCDCIIKPKETILLINKPVKFDGVQYSAAVQSAVDCINLIHQMKNTAVICNDD